MDVALYGGDTVFSRSLRSDALGFLCAWSSYLIFPSTSMSTIISREDDNLQSSGKGASVPPPWASPELLPRMEIPQTVVPCRPTAPIPTHDNNTRTYCTARVRYLQIIAPSRLGESHRPITVSPGYRDPSGAQIRGCAPAPAPWRHVRWAHLRPLAKPFSLQMPDPAIPNADECGVSPPPRRPE